VDPEEEVVMEEDPVDMPLWAQLALGIGLDVGMGLIEKGVRKYAKSRTNAFNKADDVAKAASKTDDAAKEDKGRHCQPNHSSAPGRWLRPRLGRPRHTRLECCSKCSCAQG